MEPEEIEILDGACKPKKIVVTSHGITHDLTVALKRGLTSTSIGGFFIIPYLLQLGAYDLISSMSRPKAEGIPNENIALGMIFESIFGYTKGVRSLDSVSRADFGLLSGLTFLPSPSTQYRYLQSISYRSALELQISLGQKLIELGQVMPGYPVNTDGHNITTYSRKEMKLSYKTKESRYGKAYRCFYTQDQNSKKPLIATVNYSGTTVMQSTKDLVEMTRKILDQDFLMVSDKEWYIGQLIQELHEQYGVEILVPVKKTEKRIKEFEAIPADMYVKSKMGSIAAVYTQMSDFNGPLKMFLKKQPDGTDFALITPNEDIDGDTAMSNYTKLHHPVGINRHKETSKNVLHTMEYYNIKKMTNGKKNYSSKVFKMILAKNGCVYPTNC